MKTKHAHVGKAEKQLKKWGAQLDQFVAKAGEAGSEIKADYLKHLEDLKLKHRAAQAKLDELKSASGAEWESFKAGLESAGDELELAFKKVTD
jgi:capsule polysaccharide export protein KpsE/RkpR